MARKAKFPKHMNYQETEEVAAEVKAIADHHQVSDGRVLRQLARRGLRDYYERGAHLDPED